MTFPSLPPWPQPGATVPPSPAAGETAVETGRAFLAFILTPEAEGPDVNGSGDAASQNDLIPTSEEPAHPDPEEFEGDPTNLPLPHVMARIVAPPDMPSSKAETPSAVATQPLPDASMSGRSTDLPQPHRAASPEPGSLRLDPPDKPGAQQPRTPDRMSSTPSKWKDAGVPASAITPTASGWTDRFSGSNTLAGTMAKARIEEGFPESPGPQPPRFDREGRAGPASQPVIDASPHETVEGPRALPYATGRPSPSAATGSPSTLMSEETGPGGGADPASATAGTQSRARAAASDLFSLSRITPSRSPAPGGLPAARIGQIAASPTPSLIGPLKADFEQATARPVSFAGAWAGPDMAGTAPVPQGMSPAELRETAPDSLASSARPSAISVADSPTAIDNVSPDATGPDIAVGAVETRTSAAHQAIIASTPPRPMPPAELLQDLRLHLRDANPSNGTERLTEVELAPEGLGSVRIRLRSGPEGLRLHIAAERPEGADAVRRHLASFHRDLLSDGVILEEFDLAVGLKAAARRDGPTAQPIAATEIADDPAADRDPDGRDGPDRRSGERNAPYSEGRSGRSHESRQNADLPEPVPAAPEKLTAMSRSGSGDLRARLDLKF